MSPSNVVAPLAALLLGPALLGSACARPQAGTAPAADATPSTAVAPPVAAVGSPAAAGITVAGGAFTDAALADWYPQAPPELAGCTVSGQTGVTLVLQVTCPGERVLTDMRGPGVPDPGGALDTTMRTLAGLGLQSSPRAMPVDLPPRAGGEGPAGTATLVDARGEDLEMTVWVVHHMGTMPQVLSCMALASDTEATTWCPAALAGMLLPPGAALPQLHFQELRLDAE